jgi:hypothetical protein
MYVRLAVGEDGVTITSDSGISCRIGKDHVYRFVTDLAFPDDATTRGFLQLHVQVIVRGSEVSVPPQPSTGRARSSPRECRSASPIDIRSGNPAHHAPPRASWSFRISWTHDNALQS